MLLFFSYLLPDGMLIPCAGYFNYQAMKDKLLTITDIISFSLLGLLLMTAVYLQQAANGYEFTEIWAAPALGVSVCLLFQVFINHPGWLVKKTREHFENNSQPSEEVVLKWGRVFHYLRLFLVICMALLYILQPGLRL